MTDHHTSQPAESLARFESAQESIYPIALSELKRGRKETHWMWFIFPQLEGLGSSYIAQLYSIKSREEAAAYLAHPVLGPRLIECASAVLKVQGKSARAILGFPDDLKLRSSMTLFATFSEPDSVFHQVLDKYFQGQPDPRSLELLNS